MTKARLQYLIDHGQWPPGKLYRPRKPWSPGYCVACSVNPLNKYKWHCDACYQRAHEARRRKRAGLPPVRPRKSPRRDLRLLELEMLRPPPPGPPPPDECALEFEDAEHRATYEKLRRRA